jgi:anti-sigma regulatory factor (Ser/Thr protein kinase)
MNLTSPPHIELLPKLVHELRTPLHAILGMLQLLATDARAPLAPHQTKWLDHSRLAGRQMLALIDSMLDYGRPRPLGGDQAIVALDAYEELEHCAGLLEQIAIPAGVTVLRANEWPAVRVRASRTELHQVLNNLISNAIKFNRVGGTVRLRLLAQGDRIVFEVEDEGSGVAENAQAQLFVPFERGSAAGGNVPGSGLGLAIALRCAQSMAGQLEMVRTGPGGTCMRLSLPAASGPVDVATQAPTRRAIALEPDPCQALLLAAAFAERPVWDLHVYPDLLNWQAARQSSASARVDLALIDLDALDGHVPTLVRQLKSDPGFDNAVVIGLAADPATPIPQELADWRCRERLHKPYAIEPFVDLLDLLADRRLNI